MCVVTWQFKTCHLLSYHLWVVCNVTHAHFFVCSFSEVNIVVYVFTLCWVCAFYCHLITFVNLHWGVKPESISIQLQAYMPLWFGTVIVQFKNWLQESILADASSKHDNDNDNVVNKGHSNYSFSSFGIQGIIFYFWKINTNFNWLPVVF